MCSLSRFKKARRKLIANSRGFSSIVGAVFAVLVMMSLISTVFVWSLSQNTLYNNTVTQTRQADLDRANEQIQVLNTTYTPYNDSNVNVYAKIQNIGSSSVQFITVWLYVSNDTPWTKYNFTSMTNVNIQGGRTYTLNINLTATGVNSYSTYSFSSWLITARGNTVALQTLTTSSNVVINSQVSQGIGYLAMNFEEFKYFTYKSGSNYALDNFPTGVSGYTPSSSQAVVFRLNLTNYDPSGLKRTLTLNKNSLLWLYFPTVGQRATWYIVNIDANGNIQPTYSDITVPYGADNSVIVYFASKSCGVFGGNPDQVKPGSIGPGAVNLLLLGLIGGDQYGQNIPFVAVYCS